MSNGLDLDEPVALANELRPVLLRLARHLRTETHASGLTSGQIAILVAIEFNPGLTAQKLAEREGLSESSVSGHLARLEGRGMIRRDRVIDRPRVGIFLTPAGREIVASVRRQRTSWLTERLGQLTRDDRELIKAALPALDRVGLGDR